MKTVVVSVATSVSQFPAGTAPAGLMISLSDPAYAPQHITTAPYAATFSNVAPGSYTASAQAIDANGVALGDPITSTSFTVAADDAAPVESAATVSVDVPSAISVTVQ